MLLVQKSVLNKLVVTLNELSSATEDLNWLFVFTLEQDDYYTYKIYPTEVNNSERFNSFTFTEGVDVTFKFLGDYKYQVYQMPDGGSTNETLGILVETGKMRVIDTPEEVPTFTVTNTTQIYDPNAV